VRSSLARVAPLTGPSRLKSGSGKVRIALLVWLIVISAIGYYGIAIGGVYWGRYRLQELVVRDLTSAGQMADETIRRQMMEHIAELNLPLTARSVRFSRVESPRALRVSISYVETVNLLFTTKEFPVSVQITRPF